LASHYDDAQILEIILLCGFYRTVSYLANGLALSLEPSAARLSRAAD
jgi:alkylhydroperoxidase family enzyme